MKWKETDKKKTDCMYGSQKLYLLAGVIFFSDGVVSEGASLGVNFVVPPEYDNHESRQITHVEYLLKFYLSLLSL